MGVLSEILTSKRTEIQRLRDQASTLLRSSQGLTPRPVSLHREPGEPLRLIAELKFKSPSAGALSTSLDVGARASVYERCGASMMSVLCDKPFFGGDYAHLTEARAASSIPLLCKEFILDEVQLEYAAWSGADWALLIVRCLEPAQLRRLVAAAERLELGALVEVHTAEEVEVALNAGASIIGVNARDLDTLEMRAEQAAHILATLPKDVTSFHLSGLKVPADVASLARSDVDGALIGEVLMRQDDPSAVLSSLVDAARAK